MGRMLDLKEIETFEMLNSLEAFHATASPPVDKIKAREHASTLKNSGGEVFQPDIRLLILASTVGGVGITLTKAHTLIIFEPDTHVARAAQVKKRIHQIRRTAINLFCKAVHHVHPVRDRPSRLEGRFAGHGASTNQCSVYTSLALSFCMSRTCGILVLPSPPRRSFDMSTGSYLRGACG
jgi:hypothetical protein